MIKQTIESRDIDNPLVLDGPYTKLPPFPGLISMRDTEKPLEFELGMELDDLLERVWRQRGQETHLTRGHRTPPTTKRAPILRLKVATRFKAETGTMYGAEISGEITNLPERFDVRRISWSQSVSPQGDATIRVKVDDDEAHYVLPQSPPTNLHSLFRGLPFLAFSDPKFSEQLEPLLSGPIPFMVDRELERTFKERMFYVGPLRESPRRYYEITGETSADVGLRGERAVLVLERETRSGRPSQRVLEQVNKWLAKLQIAAKAEIRTLAPSLSALILLDARTNVPVNLADVGFGASQVLPIIVQGYFQPEGSILLLEQPEIHLHANSQGVLADLFIDLARSKRRLVVETHSQHMITRIQRRIAEGSFERKDLALYYFEPTVNGTRIRELQLDDYGQFVAETLPPGFFMEMYEDSSKLFQDGAKRKTRRREKVAG
jgi:hypothetical protein